MANDDDESESEKLDNPPDGDANRAIGAPAGQKTAVTDPPKTPCPTAICQDMKSDGATGNPDFYYKLAHIWAEKWDAADPDKRHFVAVKPEAALSNPDQAFDEAKIKAHAATMLAHFKTVCAQAKGNTVYMALSHGGVDLLPADQAKLAARKTQLEADKKELAEQKATLETIDKEKANKEDLEKLKTWIAEQEVRLAREEAIVTRTLFPTFSLGSQKGGLHSQLLSMDFEYFIYLDHPKAYDLPENATLKKAFAARQKYFADLKAVFTANKITALHLIACRIGKDSTFINRAAKELGVTLYAYSHYTLIKQSNGFIGLSSAEQSDDIAKATSVEPPMTPIVTGS